MIIINDKKYWDEYYKKHSQPSMPSSFAKFVREKLEPEKTLIELGCGNGRDSLYFSKKNIKITAVDQITSEINYLNKYYANKNLTFKDDDFTNLNKDIKYDYIYSRFTFHSINSKKEERVIQWIGSQLNIDGRFFLEVRSIKDPMFKKGKQISDNENVTTHYRRYLKLDDIIKKLESQGLTIEYKIESQGLAKYQDDDPMVIRIIAKK
ncbi:MAG: methyltransferase domain-containing protein [Methanobacteriaceae archaeon]|nr:methyltransferase domain-containing protein [Methanobacteriaceae archaeon]